MTRESQLLERYEMQSERLLIVYELRQPIACVDCSSAVTLRLNCNAARVIRRLGRKVEVASIYDKELMIDHAVC